VSLPQIVKLTPTTNLVGGELGDGLGALRHGVLGELTGEHQAHGGLDLAGRQGSLLVVASQAGSLTSESLEDIVDERVHDGHTLLGDTSLGVDLLQHLVDVAGVALHALTGALAGSGLLGLLSCLLTNCGSLSHC
jgi:hypothetical protein